MIYGAMATLAMMYPARGGLVLGHIRGCYLKSEGLHLRGGLYNILSDSDDEFN